MQNKFFVLAILLSLAFMSRACADPTQTQGNCTSCATGTQILVKGFCYQKITGCLNYDIGPICTKCQNGYVLADKTCIREAVFFNRTDLTPAPLVPNIPPKLTEQQIRSNFLSSYGPEFLLLHDFFKNLNPNLTTVEKVEKVRGKLGLYISILYNNAENKQFLGWAFISNANQIKNPRLEELIGMPTDIVTAINLVKNLVEVQNFALYQVSAQYTIDFIDESNLKDVVRINIDRRGIAGVTQENLREKISINKLQITDLALEEIVKIYPYLDPQIAMSIDKGNNFYTFFFGSSISVSAQFRNFYFVINTPLASKVPEPKAPIPGIVGGWSELSNNSTRYQDALTFVKQEIPQLAPLKDVYVQSQVVAGTNYRITFEPLNNVVYQITIYYPLFDPLQITKLQIYAVVPPSKYNYNKDNIFFYAYAATSSRSSVANIPPIRNVEKVESQNQTYYKVIYSDTEYMEFIIQGKQVHLTGYFVEGNNILDAFKDYIITVDFPVSTPVKEQPASPTTPSTVTQVGTPLTMLSSSSDPCSKAAQYTILTSDSPNLIDILLYNQIVAAIRLYKSEWIQLKPVLVLVNDNEMKAYIDDTNSLFEVILGKKDLLVEVTEVKVLAQSTGGSILNSDVFPYASLIIPKGVITTVSMVDLVNQIADISETALPQEIINPKILIASKISTGSYRLLITTDKSPKDPESKYYIQYDTIVSSFGYVKFYDAKKVLAKHIELPSCGAFSADGQCLDCQNGQISYGGQCFEKVKNCQNQALGVCLRCSEGFGLIDNACVPNCV